MSRVPTCSMGSVVMDYSLYGGALLPGALPCFSNDAATRPAGSRRLGTTMLATSTQRPVHASAWAAERARAGSSAPFDAVLGSGVHGAGLMREPGALEPFSHNAVSRKRATKRVA